MADKLLDYRRIAVKGITALEQAGRFTIRVFAQVRNYGFSIYFVLVDRAQELLLPCFKTHQYFVSGCRKLRYLKSYFPRNVICGVESP